MGTDAAQFHQAEALQVPFCRHLVSGEAQNRKLRARLPQEKDNSHTALMSSDLEQASSGGHELEVKRNYSPPPTPEAGCNLQVIFEPIRHQAVLPETNFGDQGTLAQKKKNL